MKPHTQFLFCCLIFHLTSLSSLYSQDKFEIESRAKASEVPEPATQFLETSLPGARVKWFREESDKGISFEGKTKVNRQRYSIEFNENGENEDVEMLLPESKIPESTRTQIHAETGRKFTKYTFTRLQLQWSGEDDEVMQAIQAGKAGPGVTVRYEIELKGRSEAEAGFYELLFDDQGSLLQSRRIVSRNTDNLDF